MIRLPYIFSPLADRPQTRQFGTLVARNFRLPPQLGEIMFMRGITTLEAAEQFLHPQLSMLPSPQSMKGMQAAVDLIITAHGKGQPMLIHGDYDVDGITATTLLTAFFREVGIRTALVIPNRLDERYGLSVPSIDRLLSQMEMRKRGGVLITVDCGISAFEEVRYAREQGLQVIITDHHEPQAGQLPEAEAVLNPKQADCCFPFDQLAGVGVAFFLVMALRKALSQLGLIDGGRINLKKYLDLVALGTVADVVPLVGINRILVRAGLEVLSAKQRPGIFALCERCGIAEREVLAEDISFKLAPRINASGRLGTPLVGVDLLLAESAEAAQQPADTLDQLNEQRKQLELSALEVIEPQCRHQVQAGWNGLAVYHRGCHPGVLGIVASRIAERFGRPAIIFTDEQAQGGMHHLKGSGRSISGIHLFQLLQHCTQYITQYGGHAMAIGLTIEQSLLGDFAQLFNQEVINRCAVALEEEKGIEIDFHIAEKSQLTRYLARSLQALQPFGEGNPEPTFLLSSERLVRPRPLNGHLRFQVQANGHVFPGIGFRLAQQDHDYQEPHDLVFHLKRSWFRGVEQDQVQAIHVVSC